MVSSERRRLIFVVKTHFVAGMSFYAFNTKDLLSPVTVCLVQLSAASLGPRPAAGMRGSEVRLVGQTFNQLTMHTFKVEVLQEMRRVSFLCSSETYHAEMRPYAYLTTRCSSPYY